MDPIKIIELRKIDRCGGRFIMVYRKILDQVFHCKKLCMIVITPSHNAIQICDGLRQITQIFKIGQKNRISVFNQISRFAWTFSLFRWVSEKLKDGSKTVLPIRMLE
jgi:hypothetical protein